MTVNDTPTLLDVALHARDLGYAVIPPAQDGTKKPLGEWKQYQREIPGEDQLRAWYANGRTGIGVITGAVSGNLEMLEFEGRAINENISEAFVDLAAQAGLTDLINRINAGYCEATPSGGLHLLYRVDGPVAGNTKLARRPATPDELAEDPDDRIKVLIETRGEGGYVVIAPTHGTVHPTGSPWVLLNGDLDTVVTISADERDALHAVARALDSMPAAPPPSARPAVVAGGDDRPGDTYNQAPDAAARTLQLLERHGWAHVFSRPHDGHTDLHLRRPGKQIGTSAVLHDDNGTLVVFSTSTPFDTEVAYSPFAVLTVLEHHGDYAAAARALGGSSAPRDDLSWAQIAPAHVDPDTGEITRRGYLPDTFWNARPVLQHIRQAARSRLVSPDAVLGSVLARVAAITPHTVELPATIGAPMGLTTYVAVSGPSEAGKSASANVAGELLPAPGRVLDRLPVGSGEGMVEILFETVEEDDEKGKKRKVKQQTKHAAIFHIDEGAVLGELANRQGTTLLPTLRSAYTHATLGNTNASAERKRIVDGRTYVYGITLGIQPELAGPLLSDAAAGTPQRFLWVNATDPDAAPGHTWPGALPWEPPDEGTLDTRSIIRGGYKRHPLGLHPDIYDEVVADRVAVMRGEKQRASLDAHQVLVRLKVAALLALLDQRIDIDLDDWALAAQLLANSHQVRAGVEGTLTILANVTENARVERHARLELHVEETKETRALASAARSVANVVHRHAEAGTHDDPAGCARRCCHAAIASKHRALITVDDALTEAHKRGWITAEGDRWSPGDARPA